MSSDESDFDTRERPSLRKNLCKKTPLHRTSSHEESNSRSRKRSAHDIFEDTLDTSIPMPAFKENKTLRKTIEPYIEQVFKVIASGNDFGGHSGTAWVFNAERGILATNHHVTPPDYNIYKLEARDGTLYQGNQVKVLGVSPSTQYGDYAFLHVPDLAGRFTQMPMVDSHTVKLTDTVGFVGNSYGELSVEEGMVNNCYVFDMIKAVESFQVRLLCRGGASGSPVFNEDGIINGLLYAGDDIHSIIHPIWFVQRAYNIMMSGPIPRPITMNSFHFVFETMTLPDICNYRGIDASLLSKYVSQDNNQKQTLLMLTGYYSPTTAFKNLEDGDILLSVNRQKIGCNTILLTQILDATPANKPVRVKVLRGDQIVSLKVLPNEVTQSFPTSIEHGGLKIFSNTASLFNFSFAPEAALYAAASATTYELETDDDDIFGTISMLDNIPVNTFDEALVALHQIYVTNEREYLTLTSTGETGKQKSVSHFDFTAEGHIEPYVTYFDHNKSRWAKTLLTTYLQNKGLIEA